MSARQTLGGKTGCLLLVFVFGLSFAFMSWVMDRWAKVAVTGTPPETFPVLVLTGSPGASKAEVVYARELPAFLREHPTHSFLVPPGEEHAVADQLQALQGFSVRQLGQGRQLLEVVAPWNDDVINVGWYEATSSGFTPKSYKLVALRDQMPMGFFGALAITFVVGGAVALGQKWSRRATPNGKV